MQATRLSISLSRAARIAPVRRFAPALYVASAWQRSYTQIPDRSPMAQDIPYDGVNNFPPEVERIAKDIQKLNVMDLVLLGKLLKKTFGIENMVMAAPAAAATAAAPAAEKKEAPAPKVEEKKSFDVKITGLADGAKFNVIKVLRTLKPELTLVQAKGITDKLPAVVLEKGSKEEAEKWVAELAKAGAQCSM